MYSSTPTPINNTVKSMASTRQNINVFFNSEKDTEYKKIEGYKDPEKYLGRVVANPELVGREYKIKFEKETIIQPYMWFNDRIVEIEPLTKPSVKPTSLNKPNFASMDALNKGTIGSTPYTSTVLESNIPSAVSKESKEVSTELKENNWVDVANSNENAANENNWVQVKKGNKLKGTFGGKSRKKFKKITKIKMNKMTKRTKRNKRTKITKKTKKTNPKK